MKLVSVVLFAVMMTFGTAFKVFSKKSFVTRHFTMSVADEVNKAIASNDVMVFSKTYCPYCSKGTKML